MGESGEGHGPDQLAAVVGDAPAGGLGLGELDDHSAGKAPAPPLAAGGGGGDADVAGQLGAGASPAFSVFEDELPFSGAVALSALAAAEPGEEDPDLGGEAFGIPGGFQVLEGSALSAAEAPDGSHGEAACDGDAEEEMEEDTARGDRLLLSHHVLGVRSLAASNGAESFIAVPASQRNPWRRP